MEPTKDEIIHALHVSLVEMTARNDQYRELVEQLMEERLTYTATRYPVYPMEVP